MKPKGERPHLWCSGAPRRRRPRYAAVVSTYRPYRGARLLPRALSKRTATSITSTGARRLRRPRLSALESEHKQVTVPFADLKGSMELLADRDPEAACKVRGGDGDRLRHIERRSGREMPFGESTMAKCTGCSGSSF